jgi:hypothetical protein
MLSDVLDPLARQPDLPAVVEALTVTITGESSLGAAGVHRLLPRRS